MDARRFDGLSKAWSAGTSRRRLLRALPAIALGSLLPASTRAFDGGIDIAALPSTTTDVTEEAVGAEAAPVTTEPAAIAAPPAVSTEPEAPPEGIGAQISPTQVLPARIYPGLCGQLGAEPAFQLIDIGAVGAQGTATPASTEPVGAASAIPVRYSTTIVDAQLSDLTATDYAIDVRIDAADPATSVVCGDIGGILNGQVPGTELAIGLAQQNVSGYTGIAWLRDEGEQTVVNVFIAAGLAGGTGGLVGAPVETPAATTDEAEPAPVAEEPGTGEAEAASAFAAGMMVFTSAEVNLRASPSLNAAIIATLGAGVELEVTGDTTEGWVPVMEVSTGRRGYVTDAFIIQE